jgi:hypothetical protein
MAEGPDGAGSSSGGASFQTMSATEALRHGVDAIYAAESAAAAGAAAANGGAAAAAGGAASVDQVNACCRRGDAVGRQSVTDITAPRATPTCCCMCWNEA